MMDSQQRTYNLEHQSIPSLLLHYAIPAVVGSMVIALYNIVDRIFIGQVVGEYAIAGLALTFPFLVFMQAFGMLIGTGTSARVSIKLGQGDIEGAEKILGSAIPLTILTQVLTIIPAMIWMDPLLEYFGGSERTIPYAMEYLHIMIPGNFLSVLTLSYNAAMRASGYPRKAMYTMLIGAVINTILDAIFIYGLGWGISGAAWATIIAMTVSTMWVMAHFISPTSVIRIRRSNIRFSLGQTLAIITIGISPFCVQLLSSLVSILVNYGFIGACSTREEADLAIGAYSVVISVATLGAMFMLGISQGMQPIVGFNYGAGHFDRVRKTFSICIGINMMVGLLLTIASVSFPKFLAQLFVSTPSMTSYATYAIQHCLWAFIIVGYQTTAVQFFQSIGSAREAFILSISRQTLFLIPMLIIMPRIWGTNGVWFAPPTADTLAGILSIILVWRQLRKMDASYSASVSREETK